jgi:ubiquinone/menaquinone biosynthesis C-methylase UbiE
LVGRHLVARMLNKHNLPTVTAAADVLRLRAGEAGADLGFGGGVGLGVLLERVGPDGRVYGVDFSPPMVEHAAARFRDDRLTLLAGSITALPLDDASVDGAICVNVAYFVADLDLAFAEVARVLRPGGRFVLGVSDPDAMRKDPVARTGFRIRPVEELTAALEAAGLPVKEHRRIEHGFHLLATARG